MAGIAGFCKVVFVDLNPALLKGVGQVAANQNDLAGENLYAVNQGKGKWNSEQQISHFFLALSMFNSTHQG